MPGKTKKKKTARKTSRTNGGKRKKKSSSSGYRKPQLPSFLKKVGSIEHVRVCPHCGSSNVSGKTPRILSLPLSFSQYSCKNCRYKDILFPRMTKEHAREFHSELHDRLRQYYGGGRADSETFFGRIFAIESIAFLFLGLAGIISLIYLSMEQEKEVLFLTIGIWVIFLINFLLLHHFTKRRK